MVRQIRNAQNCREKRRFVLPRYQDRQLALWAGEGINEKVPADFWQEIIDLMISEFKVGHFSKDS
jgi:uncharacterized membrane protein